MARDQGSYERDGGASGRMVGGRDKGSVTANNRTEQGAYAVPLVRENNDLRIELARLRSVQPGPRPSPSC